MRTRISLIIAILTLFCVFLLLIFPLGCGGGGGSDFSYSGASIHLDVSPTKIETGGRLQVSVSLSDVNEDGVMLKVRFPKNFEYVLNSSSLLIDKYSHDISPYYLVASDVSVTPTPIPEGSTDISSRFAPRAATTTPDSTADTGPFWYLVYFLSSNQFGNGKEGSIIFQLRGVSTLESGYIEIDADVDDPNIEKEDEFSVYNPQFSAEDKITVAVQDFD